jgi:hypothetical protein
VYQSQMISLEPETPWLRGLLEESKKDVNCTSCLIGRGLSEHSQIESNASLHLLDLHELQANTYENLSSRLASICPNPSNLLYTDSFFSIPSRLKRSRLVLKNPYPIFVPSDSALYHVISQGNKVCHLRNAQNPLLPHFILP